MLAEHQPCISQKWLIGQSERIAFSSPEAPRRFPPAVPFFVAEHVAQLIISQIGGPLKSTIDHLKQTIGAWFGGPLCWETPKSLVFYYHWWFTSLYDIHASYHWWDVIWSTSQLTDHWWFTLLSSYVCIISHLAPLLIKRNPWWDAGHLYSMGTSAQHCRWLLWAGHCGWVKPWCNDYELWLNHETVNYRGWSH